MGFRNNNYTKLGISIATSHHKELDCLIHIHKETSRRVLLERRNFKPGSHKDKDNWHFITAPNNYELATDIIYEEGRSPEEISEEILERINQKNRNVNTSRDEI